MGLALTGPLIALAAIAVRRTIGKPCLFRQDRGGLKGKVFTLYKVRTMTECQDLTGILLPDEQRLTRLGRLLRKTSIDELPQLWNVLIGDMSLVGPRPWLSKYLHLYDAWQQRRHEVRPGITGWSQIQGRNATSWQQRFELDIWYVDHWSLGLDWKILVATVCTVIKREGISQQHHASMPEFEGVPRQLDARID